MRDLRLALRMLLRDFRAGELTTLGIALLLAVAALTSVQHWVRPQFPALIRLRA